MFNLDQAIAEWRGEMAAAGVDASRVLDELENHLRDEVEMQAQEGGTGGQQAFEAAVRRIGDPHAIRQEFAKASQPAGRLVQVKQTFLRFAGIPNLSVPNDMNTTPSITAPEPAWATYAKAATFLTPALGLWAFSALMLLPKLNQICHQAGQVLPGAFQLVIFVTQHAAWFCAMVFVGLALLEWQARGWPRYRRTSIGFGVFLLNAVLLLQITAMVFFALIAAPQLFQHGG